MAKNKAKVNPVQLGVRATHTDVASFSKFSDDLQRKVAIA